MCHSPQPPHHPHLWFFTLVCFPIFLDQCRSIISNWFVLNMVQGLYLQLRSHPPLFCNFGQFNVKSAAARHPIIQKEVDELLAMGVLEPSSGVAGFYSSLFVVPKHTSGLLKMPTIRHVWQLFSMVIMLSPLISRMLIYIFLLLSIIIFFYTLLAQYTISVGSFTFWVWPQPLGFSWLSLNLSCSFAITEVSMLLSIWMTSWSWFSLRGQVRGLSHFCALYWFALDYILIFQVWPLSHSDVLFLGVMLGYCPYVSISSSW